MAQTGKWCKRAGRRVSRETRATTAYMLWCKYYSFLETNKIPDQAQASSGKEERPVATNWPRSFSIPVVIGLL